MYHELTWSPETIQRFWDFYSSNAARHGTYFSSLYGEALLTFVGRRVRLDGTIIDLGCGKGDLLDALLRCGWTCRGIDSSPVAVDQVQKRFSPQGRFLGASTGTLEAIPLKPGEAGAVFVVEVLEHLDAVTSGRAFAELRRVIRPGGHLIVTVPNEEDLDANKLACPECGCVFHRMQHLRSFNSQSLSQLLLSEGFKVESITATNLAVHGARGFSRAVAFLRRITHAFRQLPKPHLIAIGKRS
jgi:SAM-dependent methyltransferase